MQITPAYIDAPKAGKTNWSVKDTAGVYYSCKPELVGGLTVGVPAEINVSHKDFNGKNFTFIDAVVGGQAPVPTNGGTAPQQAAPTPTTASVDPDIYPWEDKRSKQIAVLAAVNNGTDDADAIRRYLLMVQLVKSTAKQVYDKVHTAPASPQQLETDVEPLDDQIPF
jgi:hypothetical protein